VPYEIGGFVIHPPILEGEVHCDALTIFDLAELYRMISTGRDIVLEPILE
jgi:hypothetical protein